MTGQKPGVGQGQEGDMMLQNLERGLAARNATMFARADTLLATLDGDLVAAEREAALLASRLERQRKLVEGFREYRGAVFGLLQRHRNHRPATADELMPPEIALQPRTVDLIATWAETGAITRENALHASEVREVWQAVCAFGLSGMGNGGGKSSGAWREPEMPDRIAVLHRRAYRPWMQWLERTNPDLPGRVLDVIGDNWPAVLPSQMRECLDRYGAKRPSDADIDREVEEMGKARGS